MSDAQVPVVQVDYLYPLRVHGPKVLCMVDVSTGFSASTLVSVKGSQNFYAVRSLMAFLEEVGKTNHIILQVDPEPALVEVVRFAAAKMTGQVELRTTPPGSHSSNGSVERFIQAVEAMTRTLLEDLKAQYRLSDEELRGSRLVAWAVRHAGWLRSRFQVRPSGRTAFHELRGKPYAHEVLPFAEVVHVKTGARNVKLKSDRSTGAWVGRSTTEGEHVALTPKGAISSRTVRRVPQQERHDLTVLNAARGVPWNASEISGQTTVLPNLMADSGVFGRPVPTPGCRACQGARGFHHTRGCMRKRAEEQSGQLEVQGDGQEGRDDQQEESQAVVVPREALEDVENTGGAASSGLQGARREAEDEVRGDVKRRMTLTPKKLTPKKAEGDDAMADQTVPRTPPRQEQAGGDEVRRRLVGKQAVKRGAGGADETDPVRRRLMMVQRHVVPEAREIEEKVRQDVNTQGMNLEMLSKMAQKLDLDPEACKGAIERELQSLEKFGVYTEIDMKDVPEDAEVIGTAVVLGSGGTVVKGRPCAQDFADTWREDTYAPTPNGAAIRTLLTLAP